MGWPVVTVASGGIPVVDNTAGSKIGMAVSEAANSRGTAVTKVASGGIPVLYVATTLQRSNDQADRSRARQVARR